MNIKLNCILSRIGESARVCLVMKVRCGKFKCHEDIHYYFIRPKLGPVAKNATPRPSGWQSMDVCFVNYGRYKFKLVLVSLCILYTTVILINKTNMHETNTDSRYKV